MVATAYAFNWVVADSQPLKLIFGLLLVDVGVCFVIMLVLLCRKKEKEKRKREKKKYLEKKKKERSGMSRSSSRP